jgi:ubiquitin-like protein Pup
MAEQIRRQQQSRRRERDRTEALEETDARPAHRSEAVRDDLDDLLEEIDEVLEQNAEEFVKAYVQKGGQ